MKIGIVTETYPPEINGVALTVNHFVNSLVELGHEIFLIRPSQNGTEPPHPASVEEYLVPGLPIPGYDELRFGLPVLGGIGRKLRKADPDALYIATEGPLGFVALEAARKRSIRVLTGYHTRFDDYVQHYRAGIARKGVEAYLKRFHNRSSGTLVPTSELREALLEQGFENVMILERAVDTAMFDPAKRSEQLRAEWGVATDTPVFLYVGRVAAEKNLELAARAFRAAQELDPSARFVIVGRGPQQDSFSKKYPDFLFRGLRLGEDLAAHYASADYFLFPSLTETFGNVVLEALASGLPLVAFDYAAARDFVTDSKNGFLAPRTDEPAFIHGARKLLEQHEDLPAMRAGARAAVSGLQPVDVAAKLAAMLAGESQ